MRVCAKYTVCGDRFWIGSRAQDAHFFSPTLARYIDQPTSLKHLTPVTPSCLLALGVLLLLHDPMLSIPEQF